MDIEAIDDAIYELENSPTTKENVSELASLYIVRKNLLTTQNSQSEPPILPCYYLYVEAKREYQLDKTTEGAVVKSMNDLCRDLGYFFDRLYSNTDMAKERRCISDFVATLYTKFHND